ncbi:hypothetical protein H1Q78_11790 [Cellulosimicrobium cellulans]|uniref:hypothetical protein n=1 Tax=Cellulosimicrobium cellulans TaxID=1710 RepID=UPI001EDC7789|nr:hypothetical protein [Cellulosimicrobium cellulans]UKJ62465.1 hypothetical protein H1Q78_11790 [Cellulosimicrobium cellulans]
MPDGGRSPAAGGSPLPDVSERRRGWFAQVSDDHGETTPGGVGGGAASWRA